MNLAIRGTDAHLGPRNADPFRRDLHPDLRAAYVLATGNMSSNQSGDCNARSARRNWVVSSQGLGSQRDIRQKLIEADLVDCMVALPGQLFYSTHIPVCLGFLAKNCATFDKLVKLVPVTHENLKIPAYAR